MDTNMSADAWKQLETLQKRSKIDLLRILLKLFDAELNNAELNNIEKGTSNKALKLCNTRDAYSRHFIAT